MPIDPDTQAMECPCGNVFDPEVVEVDRNGERWTKCPKCQRKLLIPVET